jgi:hypothetical protein
MVKKVNSGAIVGIAIGVAVIILAVVLLGNSSVGFNRLSASDLSTSSQFQLSYSFGADFYTEMFGVTYNVLQQLVAMSKDNAANIASATNSIVSGVSNGLSQIVRMLAFVILAIGAGVIGLSFSKLFVWIPSDQQNAFAPILSSPENMPSATSAPLSSSEPEKAEAEEELPEECINEPALSKDEEQSSDETGTDEEEPPEAE